MSVFICRLILFCLSLICVMLSFLWLIFLVIVSVVIWLSMFIRLCVSCCVIVWLC